MKNRRAGIGVDGDNGFRTVVAKQLANLPKEEQQKSGDAIEAQMKRCNSKWFRYYLTYDPIISLKHLKIPVLVLNGELDSQVSPKQNLPVIAKILEMSMFTEVITMDLHNDAIVGFFQIPVTHVTALNLLAESMKLAAVLLQAQSLLRQSPSLQIPIFNFQFPINFQIK